MLNVPFFGMIDFNLLSAFYVIVHGGKNWLFPVFSCQKAQKLPLDNLYDNPVN